MQAPELQIAGEHDANSSLKATDGVLPELLYLLCVFKRCALPTSQAHDGLLGHHSNWFMVDMETLL